MMVRTLPGNAGAGLTGHDRNDLHAPEQSVPLEWKRARDWLGGRGMRLTLDPPPRQFGGGLANLNYLITLDDAPAVLRRPPMGELPPGAHDMAREHRILRGLA